MYYEADRKVEDRLSIKAKNIAMNNNEPFHLIAILRRGKHVVKVGTNSKKTHPAFERTYKNGEKGYHLHAEMDVLRFAKPGDNLEVLRWNAMGELKMAFPCEYCQKAIKDAKINKVTYSDWDGKMISFKVEKIN